MRRPNALLRAAGATLALMAAGYDGGGSSPTGGAPAANDARNLVLGDLNVDPARIFWGASAATWNRYVGDGLAAEPTSASLFNIDHLASDVFDGSCTSAEVTEIVAFDHVPIVCNLSPASSETAS